MSRAPKQLSAEQIAERAERVFAIESVTALAQAPEQALRYYTQLTDVKLRSAMEPQWGIYIAESSKVIRRALAAGHQPVSFLMSEKWLMIWRMFCAPILTLPRMWVVRSSWSR